MILIEVPPNANNISYPPEETEEWTALSDGTFTCSKVAVRFRLRTPISKKTRLTLNELAHKLTLNPALLKKTMKIGYEARLRRMITKNIIKTLDDVKRMAKEDFANREDLYVFTEGKRHQFTDHRSVLRGCLKALE